MPARPLSLGCLLALGFSLVIPPVRAETGAATHANGRLAFMSDRYGATEIATSASNGSGPSRATNHPGMDESPAWSPDGTQIAFSSDRDGDWEIFVMNADGSGLAQLTHNGDRDIYPAWSPDGTRIVFSRALGSSNNTDLFIMYSDGTAQTPLYASADRDEFAEWSPDGSRIAFGRGGLTQDFEIVAIGANGQNPVPLTTNTAEDMFPTWSPDGARIAFSSATGSPSPDIHVMDSNGTNFAQLTHEPGDDATPTWSPDGNSIVFMSDRDGNRDLFTMAPDGSGETPLTRTLENENQPSWQRVVPLTVTGGTAKEGKRVKVQLRLPAAVPHRVVVGYSTSTGKAKPRKDFVPVDGTVVIPAGQASAFLTIKTRQDKKDEAKKEKFGLSAFRVDGTPMNAVLKIKDDD